MKFSELIQSLEGVAATSLTSVPHIDPDLSGVAAIDEAASGTISYMEGAKYAAALTTTRASALILPLREELQGLTSARGIAWVSTADPRLMFARAIAQFYRPFRPAPGIHPTAVIDGSAVLGEGVSIGAYAVIQAGVTLGNAVCIHPHVVIYPEVSIGDRTLLHAHCTIHERTQIGADCVIHSGAAIGSEGFGFVPVPDGWVKMEQSGRVVLEDGVEVGCHSAIDRPAVGETRIGRNTKIDNLVQVAHGCHIQENTALAAQVGLAGGVQVGRRVILGGQVGVANNTRIGEGVQAGFKAALHGHVNSGEVMMGVPATPYRTFLKVSAIYSRLPEVYQALKELQKRVQQLER